MASVVRTKVSVAKLAARLTELKSGSSSRVLPDSIKSLRLRYEGIKGNAPARHWTKAVIPGLAYTNSKITVVNEQPPKPVDGTTAEESAYWRNTPGVFIEYHDPQQLPSFFPLTSSKSATLVDRFFNTIESPSLLNSLAREGAASLNPKQDKVIESIEAIAEKESVVETPIV